MTSDNGADKRVEEEIREAASLTPAVHKTAPPARASATADSSGYVDLTALLAADPDWIDRAIDASRIRADAMHGEGDSGRASTRTTPRSLAPVAMSSLVDPAERDASTWSPRKRPRRRALGFALLGVAVVGAAVGGNALLHRAPSSPRVTSVAALTIMPPAITPPAIATPPLATKPALPEPAPTPAPLATSNAANAANDPSAPESVASPAPSAAPSASTKLVGAVGGAAPPKASPRGRPATGHQRTKTSSPVTAGHKAAPRAPAAAGAPPSLLEMMRSSAHQPPKKAKP
jgi:hypothetical protein